MKKELLQKYVKLETKFKELEAEKQSLREEIVFELKRNKLEKVDSEYGSFTVCQKISWTYTDAVTKIANKLKIAQSNEQKKGVAKSSVSEYLLYKTNN